VVVFYLLFLTAPYPVVYFLMLNVRIENLPQDDAMDDSKNGNAFEHDVDCGSIVGNRYDAFPCRTALTKGQY